MAQTIDFCSYQLDIRRADDAPDVICLHFNGIRERMHESLAIEIAQDLVRCVSEKPPTGDEHAVRERRQSLDLTQQHLADMTGLSRTYISEIERGEAQNLSVRAARSIAAALECSLDDLF